MLKRTVFGFFKAGSLAYAMLALAAGLLTALALLILGIWPVAAAAGILWGISQGVKRAAKSENKLP